MGASYISNNLTLFIPFCCSERDHAALFKDKILDSLKVIDQTNVGHVLLEKIRMGAQSINISTHSLDQDCDQDLKNKIPSQA